MQIKVLALKTASSTKLAIFTTLLGASVLAPLFHFQPITGPIVNAMLFLGAVVLPIEYALMLCMLPSLVALSVGTLPVALAPMLPFIMFSNAILVVAFSYLEGVKLLPKARKEFHSFLAGRSETPSKAGERAVKIIFNKMIKPTIKRMGIKYDVWFSEKSLYKSKKVEKTLSHLKTKGLAYEKEGALWFASTKFGDDKDRVLVKADGEETYLASDIAYIKDKKDRGFDKIIYFWGADHHGYVGRMKSAASALGHNPDDFIFLIMQLVKLFKEGKEVRMSKRVGVYVLLDELLDEVGPDATRFFFLTRTYNTHLNFDLGLAKEKSQKNPVYYIQYAHARMASILGKVKRQKLKGKIENQNLNLLTHSSELNLIKQLIKLPEVVEDTAGDYQVQRLPQYATDLATAFHRFYTDCHVIDKANKTLTQARLALVKATQITLKNTLALMGITAPNKM